MIAPNTDCMVLTPIAPHSLSFRPIVINSCQEVRFTISMSARQGIMACGMGETILMDAHQTPGVSPEANYALRSTAPLTLSPASSGPCPAPGSPSHPSRRWAAIASFDGSTQVPLGLGDYVEISTSPFALPHLNMHHPFLSNESLWLRSLTHKLHFNLTTAQLRLLEEQSIRARNNERETSSQELQEGNEQGLKPPSGLTTSPEPSTDEAAAGPDGTPHTALARQFVQAHNQASPMASGTTRLARAGHLQSNM